MPLGGVHMTLSSCLWPSLVWDSAGADGRANQNCLLAAR